MKKFIVCISILMLLLSVLVACGDKDAEGETTTTTESTISTVDPDYSMTEPLYTVGDVKTSERYGSDNRAYVVNYYDENDFITKQEVFENGIMVYYYTVSATDDMGNCIQAKYYTVNGKFVAIFDNGFFFDADGSKISETEFENRLRS